MNIPIVTSATSKVPQWVVLLEHLLVANYVTDYQAGANTGGTKKKKRRMNFKKNNRCVPEVSSSQV